MAMNYRIYVDTGESGFAELPVPSGMSQGLYDISSDKAGRTEATTMMKNRLGTSPKIELTYTNRDTAVITQAIALTSSEYFNLLYLDLLHSGEYAYGEFYRGDVSSQVYNGALDIWSSAKFSLIKRDGKAGVPCVSHTSVNLPTSGSASTVNVSSLGTISSATAISRSGSITVAVDENDSSKYVIARGSASVEGTVIIADTSGKTIIVEVTGA